MDEDVIRVLRAQAWERAKGELRSVGKTFYSLEKRDEYYNLVEKFIDDVELRELAE